MMDRDIFESITACLSNADRARESGSHSTDPDRRFGDIHVLLSFRGNPWFA